MNEMIYTPKVGDRVKWFDEDSYTVTAVGKRYVLVVDDYDCECAAFVTDLTPISDTVTIEIPRKVAEIVAKHWRGVGMNSASVTISDACRAVLSGDETR